MTADRWNPVAIAARRALYDQHDQINNRGSIPIGPSFPGGSYEGIVTIREDVVRANATLTVATLPERPWEYQVVVSIDAATGAKFAGSST